MKSPSQMRLAREKFTSENSSFTLFRYDFLCTTPLLRESVMTITRQVDNHVGQENEGVGEVNLANNLLKSHLADEESRNQKIQVSEEVTHQGVVLSPLAADEFKRILSIAQRIQEDNEVKALKAAHARHTEIGKQQVEDLTAHNDVVLPSAQSRILDLYGIPTDVFELARSQTKLGEDQNNFRSLIAISLGLPASASREVIYAEQKIEKDCTDVLSEIKSVMALLQEASRQGKFRDDLVDNDGCLLIPSGVDGSSSLSVMLFIDTAHLNYTVEYPGLSFIEKIRDWFDASFVSDQQTYGEKKFARYDISFSKALSVLESKSPAFKRFLDALPKNIEVIGSTTTFNHSRNFRKDLFKPAETFAGDISLERMTFRFHLRGYTEELN